MFSLFVEDFELCLQNIHECHSGNLLHDLCLIVLLFADDMPMVVMGETPEDLQLSLYRLQDYCNTWSLKVTFLKKVVVFRKTG